jgi:hypothetical protein
MSKIISENATYLAAPALGAGSVSWRWRMAAAAKIMAAYLIMAQLRWLAGARRRYGGAGWRRSWRLAVAYQWLKIIAGEMAGSLSKSIEAKA